MFSEKSQEFNEQEQKFHHFFAVEYNQKTWQLHDKQNRTEAENRLMLEYAFTSLSHWRKCGNHVHEQRGEWLVSRVYALIGDVQNCLLHAEICAELTHKYDQIDFDKAYSFEALYRAHIVAGHSEKATEYYNQAIQCAELISKEEDKTLFLADLKFSYIK